MWRRPQFELNVGGHRLRLGQRTIIVGVLNVTPDSFSDGGLYLDPERAIQHGVDMALEGADWIDVGGESTRPGAEPVAAEEEMRRVLPVIRGLRRRLRSVPFSIDTTKAEVAEEAVRAGATILNDVSGLRFDPRLAEVAHRHGLPLILMHLRGTPATMQRPPFARSIWGSVLTGLASSTRCALSAGVRRSQLIIDPGLGFGKSRRQNFEILAHLDRLRRFKLPLLVGSSRKSFVRAVAAGQDLDPAKEKEAAGDSGLIGSAERREREALPYVDCGDAAAVVASILGGAHIIRVHNVKAILPAARIADAILLARK